MGFGANVLIHGSALEWNTGAAVSFHIMVKPDSAKTTLKCLCWLSLAIVAFYWQIVFTRQFSMLTVGETVNQAYSWFHFWAESVRHGSVPLWDPYTFGGHSFIGEMQTAAFYPLHLVFALFPANGNGLLSTRLYHLYFVFTHLLAAYFMFALIREMGLIRSAALLAGVCYSLGGFVGAAPWPHLLESAVWLPLQFLLMLRALQAPALRQSLTYAALAGLTLGLSILAGGLHIVMMQAIVLVYCGRVLRVAYSNRLVAFGGSGGGVDDHGPGGGCGSVASVGGVQRAGDSIHLRHVAAGHAENTHRVSGGFHPAADAG